MMEAIDLSNCRHRATPVAVFSGTCWEIRAGCDGLLAQRTPAGTDAGFVDRAQRLLQAGSSTIGCTGALFPFIRSYNYYGAPLHRRVLAV